MVSYQQLDQHGIKQVVLHERETSSSGRPKAKGLHQEDQFFHYYYDNRGGLKKKVAKTPLEQYAWWNKYNVKFSQNKRITPFTEFEKAMGMTSYIRSFIYKWCNDHGGNCITQTFSDNEWEKFNVEVRTNGHPNNYEIKQIDYGNVENSYKADVPKIGGLVHGQLDWHTYFQEKAKKMDLIVVDINKLDFREKQKPAVVEKVRPNPKEKSIASVKIEKPEPIEPIKEVAKYSPLMIAGILIVIVLFLRRRA